MAEDLEPGPTPGENDPGRGPVGPDFRENGCGYCQAARPHIEAALAGRSDIQHIKVIDGRGKPLGRSFNVKLWPTLIMLKDGVETARVVRPASAEDVTRGLETLA